MKTVELKHLQVGQYCDDIWSQISVNMNWSCFKIGSFNLETRGDIFRIEQRTKIWIYNSWNQTQTKKKDDKKAKILR